MTTSTTNLYRFSDYDVTENCDRKLQIKYYVGQILLQFAAAICKICVAGVWRY